MRCKAGEIAELGLGHDAIEYLNYDKTSGLYYWSEGRFKIFHLTD